MIVEILFIGFIGIFIHRYKLFKLLVSYSIAAMGLNLFLVLGGNIHFDIRHSTPQTASEVSEWNVNKMREWTTSEAGQASCEINSNLI